MDQLGFTESRKTQENKAFREQLDVSLWDGIVNHEEAQNLNQRHEDIKSTVDGEKDAYKTQILALTQDELSNLAGWLGLPWDSSLQDTLFKIRNHKQVEKSVTVIEETDLLRAEFTAWELEISNHNEIEQVEKSIETLSSLSEYFGISNLETIHTALTTEGLNLDIVQYLAWYKSYLENDLSDLDSGIKKKIILSIWIRISNIWKDVEAVKKEARKDIRKQNIKIEKEADKIDDPVRKEKKLAEKWDENDLSSSRWILNKKIQDSLGEVKNKILPSAFMKQEWDKANDKDAFIQDMISNMKYEYFPHDEAGYDLAARTVHQQKQAHKHVFRYTAEQISEMFAANVDPKNGQFDEFGRNQISQSRTLRVNIWNQVERFQAIGWDMKTLNEISLLNEEDKKIEKNAMLCFMWAIGCHIAIEWWPALLASVVPWAWTAAWAIVWNVLWAGIDIGDLISSKEFLLETLKVAWMVPKEYHMEKTLIDNVLAWLWLIPWVTLAVKTVKLTELMTKFWVVWSEVTQMMEKVMPLLKWWKNIDSSPVRNIDNLTNHSNMLTTRFLSIFSGLWDNEKIMISINTGFETKKVEISTSNYKEVLSSFDDHQLWTMRVLKVISDNTGDVSYSSNKLPGDWLDALGVENKAMLDKRLKEEDLKLEDLTLDDYDYFGINPDAFTQTPIDVVVRFSSWDIATFSWTPDMIMRLTENKTIVSISKWYEEVSGFVEPLYKHDPKNATIKYDELLDGFNAKIPEEVRYMSNESDLVDMPFYHGTMSTMQDSVMAGPKNLWKWFGWKWLYIAMGEERHIAEEYSWLAKQAHDLNKPGEVATKVVLEWRINPDKPLKVWTFTITRNGPVDLENGVLPAMWANDPRLQALLIREFDVLDIRWAADAWMNLQTNRILIFHESAWADAIIWKWWDQLSEAAKPISSVIDTWKKVVDKWREFVAKVSSISSRIISGEGGTLNQVIPINRRKDSFAVNFSVGGHVSVHYFNETGKPLVFEWSPAVLSFLMKVINKKYGKGNSIEEYDKLKAGETFVFTKDEDMLKTVMAFANAKEWKKTWACSKLACDVMQEAGIDIDTIPSLAVLLPLAAPLSAWVSIYLVIDNAGDVFIKTKSELSELKDVIFGERNIQEESELS